MLDKLIKSVAWLGEVTVIGIDPNHYDYWDRARITINGKKGSILFSEYDLDTYRVWAGHCSYEAAYAEKQVICNIHDLGPSAVFIKTGLI